MSRKFSPSSVFPLALPVLVMFFLHATPSYAAEACPSAPYPLPQLTNVKTVCHTGYVSLQSTTYKQPVYVAYTLTQKHSYTGCFPRTGLTFKVDSTLDAQYQGRPSDYAGTGEDLGHAANNADFAFDKTLQEETFRMTNVWPQLAGLNRQGWESAEEWVREVAFTEGDVAVQLGAVFSENAQTIGAGHLPVPEGFWKAVTVLSTGKTYVLYMPNANTPKQPTPDQWRISVATLTAKLGYAIPVPVPVGSGANDNSPFPVDAAGFRKAHAEACKHG